MFEETVSRFSSLAAQLPSFEKVEYNGGRIEKTHLYGAKSIVFCRFGCKIQGLPINYSYYCRANFEKPTRKNYSGSSLLPHPVSI
ncbi:MAG: hypothetical protein IPI59_10235 [Sphingobacteriales bacterium]|nr:hypothetical protein [Sphingobacteriales bacterium]